MPVAVVTGGAQGIGAGIVARLTQEGYTVAVLDVRERPDAGSDEAALHVRCDVARAEEVRESFAAVVDGLGRPAVLVNNAAIFPRFSAAEATSADWMRVIEINLGGAFFCAQAFHDMRDPSEAGRIVNLLSSRAFEGAIDGSHYAASKGGLLNLTRSLALEWAPDIRVNAVVPGTVDTAQSRGGLTDEDFRSRQEDTPLGRLGTPADIAAGVHFLVSEDAAFVTGQVLAVNGGALMR